MKDDGYQPMRIFFDESEQEADDVISEYQSPTGSFVHFPSPEDSLDYHQPLHDALDELNSID